MSVVCEHVTANYQVIPLRGPGQVKVRCPCCGLTAWREPDDDLDGDDCPYCYVRTERAEKTARRVSGSVANRCTSLFELTEETP